MITEANCVYKKIWIWSIVFRNRPTNIIDHIKIVSLLIVCFFIKSNRCILILNAWLVYHSINKRLIENINLYTNVTKNTIVILNFKERNKISWSQKEWNKLQTKNKKDNWKQSRFHSSRPGFSDVSGVTLCCSHEEHPPSWRGSEPEEAREVRSPASGG